MDRADGWFAGIDPTDVDSAARAIRDGRAAEPADWPHIAIETGAFEDEDSYYDALRSATYAATRQGITEHARGGDEHVKHAIRALDDLDRIGNELTERTSDWRSLLDEDGRDPGPETPFREHLLALDAISGDIQETREGLRDAIERTMHDIAPNLTAIAGPLLGARLIATAGSLERLAKMPSGTVQVLGAEDALFAHLTDGAPPPKHGLIYTHEYVRGTRPEERGSAARAVAGKLSIAARIDHYSGDQRPELEAELAERIARIRGAVDE